MARKHDSDESIGRNLVDEVSALRQELAQTRAAHEAQIQALHDAQVGLMHEIRHEQVALLQDLHNRHTVRFDEAAERGAQTESTLLAATRAAVDREAEMRERLAALRQTPAYEAAFAAERPLVSVVIPTYDNVTGLMERAIPSVLAQTYDHVEVVVVGDVAPDATAEAIAALGDPRVRYENLTVRGPYSDEPKTFWYTAGIYALNRGLALAGGQWVSILNDDDAYRPDFVEQLLGHARATRSEVAYGKLAHHEPGKPSWELGSFPPTNHTFGWQMALQHGGLRMFEYEMHAPVFDEPGDWNRAFRMLRTSVRFSMVDAVVGDYWPSTLWKGRRT